jgi:flagellar hook assembly protein FlgD
VARVLSTVFVLALLAGSAAAFALTERAKLERSPIYGTRVDQIFSPAGKLKPVAHIVFRVRPHERVDVRIVDRHGTTVATLLSNRTVKPRTRLDLVWDGITASGLLVPDGVYRPVVKLLRSHRTITLPSNIRLDAVPPKITVKHPQYPIISPDGDGHHDAFTFHYTIDEPAHAILLVRGDQVLFTRTSKQAGTLTWNGRVDGGKRAPPGRYVLSVSAQDTAGNRAKAYPFAIAQIRYVILARSRIVVPPGGRFALRVSTDAPRVRWQLHGRHGVLPRGTLHLRAPKAKGVFNLYVFAGTHVARTTVVVG